VIHHGYSFYDIKYKVAFYYKKGTMDYFENFIKTQRMIEQANCLRKLKHQMWFDEHGLKEYDLQFISGDFNEDDFRLTFGLGNQHGDPTYIFNIRFDHDGEFLYGS
jgi:hypothetical protein